MSTYANTNFRRRLANFFGGLGYFFCLLQWIAVILIYYSFIKSVLSLVTPTVTRSAPVVHVVPTTIDPASSGPLVIIAIVVTIAIVILSIYVFVKIPSTIVKTSKNVVREVAETTAPVILRVQHVQDTKQNHKRMALRITVVIKALIIIAPLLLSFCSQFTNNQGLSFNVAIYLSVLLASLAVMSFVLQYALARLLAVKRQDIW